MPKIRLIDGIEREWSAKLNSVENIIVILILMENYPIQLATSFSILHITCFIFPKFDFRLGSG